MSYIDTIQMTDSARKRLTIYFPTLDATLKQELIDRIREYYTKYNGVNHQMLNLGDIERIINNDL